MISLHLTTGALVKHEQICLALDQPPQELQLPIKPLINLLKTINALVLLLKHFPKCLNRCIQQLFTVKASGATEDQDIDHAFHNLGLLYTDQGKMAEAEKMYQRALEGYEKAWGPGHTPTLDTVNNLGILYADQGKMAEAEKMYQRALEGREKA